MEVLPLPTFGDPLAGDLFTAVVVTAPIISAEDAANTATSGSQAKSCEPIDEWTEQFRKALQIQHGRVRAFLDAQRDRWRRVETLLLRQIEMLDTEVHTLRATCGDLRQKLADVRSTGFSRNPGEGPPKGGTTNRPPAPALTNWETEKRRILAELESDDGKEDSEIAQQRLQIEDIIRKTDEIVAEKDREIEELHHLLKNQSDSLGSVAVGAAALDQLFDQDAIIRDQRERLKLLEDEARERLRRAEIEISQERARLARREVEIEERLRTMDLRTGAAATADDALCPTGRPVRGRWLARLGLTEEGPRRDEGRRP